MRSEGGQGRWRRCAARYGWLGGRMGAGWASFWVQQLAGAAAQSGAPAQGAPPVSQGGCFLPRRRYGKAAIRCIYSSYSCKAGAELGEALGALATSCSRR